MSRVLDAAAHDDCIQKVPGAGRWEGDMRHEVTLLVRADCHVCAVAREDIARICAELNVPWRTSDVDADPELRAEYGDRVPVILVDGREHGFWTVQEQRLRAALTR